MKFFALLLTSVHLIGTPLSHKLALNVIEFAKPKESIPFTGFYRIDKQCRLLFKDLGAEFIDKAAGFEGFYLSAKQVKLNSGKTFGKWRDLLRAPKNTKLIEIFEANLASSSLRDFFSFPNQVRPTRGAKEKTVILFLDYTLPCAMQVREILNFSLRGYNVLVVDFYRKEAGKYFPTWDACKDMADSAYHYLCGDIILYGKSFGSAPAAYLAVKHSQCPVILDRPFKSMSAVAESYLLEGFIDEHYAYPVAQLVQRLAQNPLIISAEGSDTFQGHAREILERYIASHKTSTRDTLLLKCFISTRGGHYSSLLNKGESSWFSYEDAQRGLNRYLLNIEN
ncbi:MAG: hypothetical protein SP4CHLAM5_02430 [Chlamydiia bacterium]|nr:hypothetical protein [Chlamydiia bacterium]MCH9618117.1 hypothetical protein [Chlamydiia bacterium]MCH9623997.1 hypothetical protein [Chlamydiia bacterium]